MRPRSAAGERDAMENAPGASAPKPIRRAPAQTAAQEKGLPQDGLPHGNAMGGFTESRRKPKKLVPGALAEKPKRKRKAVAPPPEGQKQGSLDNVPDDAVVVVASMPGPRGVVELD